MPRKMPPAPRLPAMPFICRRYLLLSFFVATLAITRLSRLRTLQDTRQHTSAPL